MSNEKEQLRRDIEDLKCNHQAEARKLRTVINDLEEEVKGHEDRLSEEGQAQAGLRRDLEAARRRSESLQRESEQRRLGERRLTERLNEERARREEAEERLQEEAGLRREAEERLERERRQTARGQRRTTEVKELEDVVASLREKVAITHLRVYNIEVCLFNPLMPGTFID